MNQNESFGRRIRRLRVEKGYSQGDLAGRLYVTVQAVSRWETERGYPSIESVVNMAHVFATSTDYLLTGHESICQRE